MKNEYLDNLMASAKEGKQLSTGERDVIWAYNNSTSIGYEVLACDGPIWESEAEDIVKTLRAAGINELYLTSQASNMYGVYLKFDELGLKLRGIVRLDNPRYKADMEQWGKSYWDATIAALKFSF